MPSQSPVGQKVVIFRIQRIPLLFMCYTIYRIELLNFMRYALLALGLMSATYGTVAAQARWVPGEVLVQLPQEVDGSRWAAQWRRFQGKPTGFEAVKQVSPPLNIWLYRFDAEQAPEQAMLSAILRHKEVIGAQFNHYVSHRALPDDALFNNQWQYLNTGQTGGLPGADIDADLAWNTTTGGTTITGDTIVVCVIDDGVNLNHPDFQLNRWVNRAEIPANNLDDDNNGYVDDHLGWSTVTNNDLISTGGSHGTPVVGIVGADGNNGVGVTGVSWHVKVMIVKNNFNTTEAKVLEAYSYPLIQRMRYNTTQGQEGAFVVATNASWGVNGGMASDSPLWCAFYDTLGVHGILNCGATANQNVNVDEMGDLPTTCPSEYLIAVTNTNHLDVKVGSAGYGLVNIDLGAPGTGAYTLASGGSYAPFGGTSSATPHVTGAIGLLYSTPCPALMTLAQSDPGAAARWIRQVILQGVDQRPSLAGITATGGRLNVNNSLNLLLAGCGDCIPPSSNALVARTDTEATLIWNTNDSLQSVDLRWRPIGTTAWTQLNDVQSPLTLQGLQACATYEYQLQGHCADSSTDFGASFFFTTDGCCEPPAGINLLELSQQQAFIGWAPVLAAQSYVLRWRPTESTVWQETTVNGVLGVIHDLQPCTQYEYQVASLCSGGQLMSSAIYGFVTDGCGACLDEAYCTSTQFDNTGEWIASVSIGSQFSHTSGAEMGGYTNYGNILPAIQLEQELEYPIVLTPGFAGNSYLESFAVWIDLNQDGVFSDTEIRFSSQGSSQPATGLISIPTDALTGITRMRVVMQFLNASDPCPFLNSYGETQDYCIHILGRGQCPSPTGFHLVDTDTTQLWLAWDELPAASGFVIEYRPLNGSTWYSANATGNSHVLSGLDDCTAYAIRLQSRCDTVSGAVMALLNAATDCVSTIIEPLPTASFKLYPNPGHEQAVIHWSGGYALSDCRVWVHDVYGRLLYSQPWKNIPAGASLEIPMAQAPAGVYSISIARENGTPLWQAKWVKLHAK